jgi:hypothetical protein
MRSILCRVSVLATLVLTIVGCSAEIRDAATDGVATFVGTTISDTLLALFPVADMVKSATGG